MPCCIDCLSHIYLKSLTWRLSISMLLWDCCIPAQPRGNDTSRRYFVDFWQLRSTSFSVGKSKQAEDLRLKEKWGRRRTVNNNFIVKNEKIKAFFGTCTPFTTLSLEQPTFHSDTYSRIWSSHHRFPPQLFSYSHFFKGRLKHDDVACCSLGALGCVCSCV